MISSLEKKAVRVGRREVKEKNHDSGTYILLINLPQTQKIKPGNLPEADYSKGIYLYVGRAMRGLRARIKRHIRKQKKLHWHIDYLLQKAKIEDIWIRPHFFAECSTAALIRNSNPSPKVPQEGFGSSDCRCSSHLFYFPPGTTGLNSLIKKLGFTKVDPNENHS